MIPVVSALFSIPAVSWTGPEINEFSLLETLPVSIAGVLRQRNGFIACAGGFHFRGICNLPDWHSLQDVWTGPRALHRLYPTIHSTDLPFAQDCFGDQFLFRDSQVWQLDAEIGEIRNLSLTLKEFLAAISTRPVEFLGLQPLVSFQEQGHSLAPEQSLLCWPPLATHEASIGLTVKALPKLAHLNFLSDVAHKMSQAQPGDSLHFHPPI